MASESTAYRADIDGLRAIAVLSIVLSHLGVRGFGGGFVGVDIFFVISGFLITGILVRGQASGSYSIAQFYSHRVVRIFPALFAMLVVTSILAAIVMMPGELLRYARSLAATSVFGSNILFFSEAGYFDASSDVKPLLHTWSLAIEEQFYLLWPLILSFAAAGRKSRGLIIVAVIALVSLAASAVMVRHAPAAAFYLLPFRAWELAAGGLLVFIGRVRNRWINEALAISGLVLIGMAIWKFASTTVFPGPAALIPVGGAALMIFAGPDTLVAKGLALRPATWVGRLSYSLYLWHWPVIVFSEIGLLLHPGPAVMAVQLLISVILAYASLRWIETPFRLNRDRWQVRNVLILAALSITLAVAVSMAVIVAKGFPQRLEPTERALAAYADRDYEAHYQRGTCFAVEPGSVVDPNCLVSGGDRPTVLLTGDSMAAHLWPGLSGYRAEFDVLQATMVGCRPGLYPEASDRCQTFARDLLTQWTPEHRPTVVVLAGRWQGYDLQSLQDTVRFLRDQRIAVVVVGPPPIYTAQLPRLLVTAHRKGDAVLPSRYTEATSFEVDAALRQAAVANGATYVSLVDAFCHGRVCRTLAEPTAPMQFDYGHFTPEGSAVAAAAIMPEIRRARLTASNAD